MISTQRIGYEQKREKILNAFGAYLYNSDWDWVDLTDVRGFMADMGFSDHETWTSVNAFASGGLIKSIDQGENTRLKLLQDSWDTDDLPQYAAASDVGEEWAELSATNDWADIGETRVPTLDTAVFEDFLDRHGYEDDDIFRHNGDHVETVASYDVTQNGIEYWRILENDERREQDRIVVMVKFNEDDSAFQPRNRTHYAEEVWTPFHVLQQRNAWVNRASRSAASDLEGLQESREAVHGKEMTVEEAYLSELTSLSGIDGSYEEMRDAVIDMYYGDAPMRYSRVFGPYSREVENQLLDGTRIDGPLAVRSDDGQEKGPILQSTHLDNLYTEARNRSM